MKKHNNEKKSLRSYEQNAVKTFQKTTSNSVKSKKKKIFYTVFCIVTITLIIVIFSLILSRKKDENLAKLIWLNEENSSPYIYLSDKENKSINLLQETYNLKITEEGFSNYDDFFTDISCTPISYIKLEGDGLSFYLHYYPACFDTSIGIQYSLEKNSKKYHSFNDMFSN